jgi:hypothetical protein
MNHKIRNFNLANSNSTKYTLGVLFLSAVFFCLSLPLSFAYIDPGAGTYLIQAMWQYIVGAIAFLSAIIIHFFRFTLKRWLSKRGIQIFLITLTVILILVGMYFFFIYSPTTTRTKADLPDYDESLNGVQIYDSQKAYIGYSLYEGKLIDMQGNVVHRWNRAIYLGVISDDGYYYAQHCFECPTFGKYTWDDKVVWEKDIPIHHDITITPRGTILTTGKEVHIYNGRNVEFDTIIEFDANGNQIDYWSSWDALPQLKAHHRPLELDKPSFMQLPENHMRNVTSIWGGNYDYYHLNSIALVPPNKLEGVHPAFNPGNLIISFRHGSMVFILDRVTKEVLWRAIHDQVNGTLDGQHTPFMRDDGSVVIFDNGRYRGNSRVIIIDPFTLNILWEYTAPEFFTESQGQVQELPNGNFFLTDSESGRAFEITRQKEIVWEYYHPDIQDETNSASPELFGKRQQIYRMTRYSPELIEKYLER